MSVPPSIQDCHAGTAPSAGGLVHVSGFVIDLALHEVRSDPAGERIDLRPRCQAVLSLLARHAGRLVTKPELMAAVWPGVVVTDDSLTQCIAEIRRVLHDHDRQIVRTVPCRGYLLVAAPVAEVGAPGLPPPPPLPPPSLPAVPAPPAPMPSPVPPQVPQPIPMRLHASRLRLVLLASLPWLVWMIWHLWPNGGELPHEAAGRRPSITVRPFHAPPGQTLPAALEGSLTTELIDALVRHRELRVLAPDASGSTPGGLRQARYAVDAEISPHPDGVWLDVRLIDTRDGSIAWADRYSVSPPGTPAMPEQIARSISARLQPVHHAGTSAAGCAE